MKMTIARVALLGGAALGLAACGGGGGGGLSRPAVTLSGNAYWAPGDGNSTGATEWIIVDSEGGLGNGTALISDNFGEVLESVFTNPNSSTIVYGSNPGNRITLRTADGQPFNSTAFDELVYYQLVYTSGGDIFGSQGVIGNAAPSVPASGTANYTGNGTATAQGFAVPGTAGGADFSLVNGDVSATANFGGATPRVSVTLSGFNPAGGQTFNEIIITDMEIVGNRFSGDDVVLRLNGTPVFGTGSREASGGFYGAPDANGTSGAGNPAEIGGVFVVNAPNQLAVGRYAAD